MHKAMTFTLICLVVSAVSGCGGGLTQQDMLKHAIRRPSDDDESDAMAPPTTKTIVNRDAVNRDKADAPVAENGPVASLPPAKTSTASSRPPARRPATAGVPQASTARTAAQDTATTPSPLPRPPAVTSKPAEPLSLVQRRQRTIDNMTKIGVAIERFTQENGRLFSLAICNAKGQPQLSWRVELLPYLGHQDLYDQFDMNEPWDSPRNKPLLTLMPEVYQSPERFDEKTNYLLPIATFTPFNRQRGLGVSNLEDGAANTVVLVEVDDSAAVPWAKPEDLPIDLKNFGLKVGSLREDGFFVVWGDGAVTRVSPERSARDLKAIFTYDGGDAFAYHLVRADATAAPAVTANNEADSVAVAGPVTPDRSVASKSPVARSRTTSSSAAISRQGRFSASGRLPIPDPHRLDRARELIREIYISDYENAKTVRDQQALAKRMLKQVSDMSDDPAGQYALLDIIAKIAAQTGDSATAITALEQLASSFEVDDLDIGHHILQQLAKKKTADERSTRRCWTSRRP